MLNDIILTSNVITVKREP